VAGVAQTIPLWLFMDLARGPADPTEEQWTLTRPCRRPRSPARDGKLSPASSDAMVQAAMIFLIISFYNIL